MNRNSDGRTPAQAFVHRMGEKRVNKIIAPGAANVLPDRQIYSHGRRELGRRAAILAVAAAATVPTALIAAGATLNAITLPPAGANAGPSTADSQGESPAHEPTTVAPQGAAEPIPASRP